MAVMSSKMLGAMLVEKGFITQRVLDQALDKQKKLEMDGRPMRLGNILIRAKKIDETQLNACLNEQSQTKPNVFPSRADVEKTYGQLTIQQSSGVSKVQLVDDSYQNRIAVAESPAGHPFILVTDEFNRNYKNVVMDVRARVIKAYSSDSGRTSSPKLIKVTPDLLQVYRTREDGGETSGPQTAVETEFEELVKTAYRAGAVDLHFFRKADICTVRFRINGALRTYAEWNTDKADRVLQVGFQTFGKGSKYSGWEKKMRQRVRIKIQVDPFVRLDCRYEHAPGDDNAYHACIRILANDKRKIKELIDLRKLGLTTAQNNALEAAVSEPSGLVILSGPTGSGKSTTLAALVKYINRNDDQNVLTVESPIERELPAFQTSVSDDEDGDRNEFANAVKSMLRRDPDYGMVGEIRDEMSASALATGVQTGHTLLSTVHAQSAIEIIERLTSPAMKIAPETIASPSFINALVFQKLLPVMDDDLKIRLSARNIDQYMDERQKARFMRLFPDFEKRSIFVRGSSPDKPEGLSGMTLCMEIIIPDDTMREHFRRMELTQALNHWRSKARFERQETDFRVDGFSAIDHAISKVESGMIDPRDLEDYFGHMDRIAAKRDEVRHMLDKQRKEAA